MIKEGALKVTGTGSGSTTVENYRIVQIITGDTNITGYCKNNGTLANFVWNSDVDLTDVLTLDSLFRGMYDSCEYEWTTAMTDVLLGDFKLAFGSAIYGRNTDGTAPSGSIFLPRNSNNHMLINYGGYLDSDSNTIIYGNNAEVRTRDSFKANGLELGKTTKYAITSFKTGWTAYNSAQQPAVRKYGNVVNFCGAFKNTAAITLDASPVQVCTLPEAYRPAQQVLQVSQGSGSNKWLLVVNTDGSVTAARYGVSSYVSATADSWFAFNATWIVE